MNTTSLNHSNGRFGRDNTDYVHFTGSAINVYLDGDQRMQITNTGQLKLDGEGGSNVKVDVRQGSAKAWARGTPSAFSDSYNFSTFTDNGVGDYTFSFTNNMNNNLWAPTTAGITTAARMINASNQQTSSTDIDGFSSSGSRVDTATGVAIHGDLA